MEAKNLTDKWDIRRAIEQQGGGHGTMASLAKQFGVHPAVVSMNVSGARRTARVLQGLANYLGQPVHGVKPSSSDESDV